jgi:zinc transporter ZupT
LEADQVVWKDAAASSGKASVPKMETTFLTAFTTSSMAALVTSLGIYTIRRFAEWGQRNTTYFMCFAAGVLISASFLHIIPKSFGMAAQAPIWLLAGFFGLHLFNRFITAFVCERNLEKKGGGRNHAGQAQFE